MTSQKIMSSWHCKGKSVTVFKKIKQLSTVKKSSSEGVLRKSCRPRALLKIKSGILKSFRGHFISKLHHLRPPLVSTAIYLYVLTTTSRICKSISSKKEISHKKCFWKWLSWKNSIFSLPFKIVLGQLEAGCR